MHVPKRDGHSPHSLGLEAVAASNTSPVAKIQARSRSVQVLRGRGDKCIGVLRIDFLGRLSDDVAIEERHWLAEGDCADDEGDEEEGVDASHDEEAEVGVGPVIPDADHDVKSGDAGLVLVSRDFCVLQELDSPH